MPLKPDIKLGRTSRKVLRPACRLSEAPMRVQIWSITCSVADLAGTRQPTCRQDSSVTGSRWQGPKEILQTRQPTIRLASMLN